MRSRSTKRLAGRSEVTLRGGLPAHAYVLDDGRAFDAYGCRELRHARMFAEEVERVSVAELLKLLRRTKDVGIAGAERVRRREWKKKAKRAAALLLDDGGQN